MSASLPLGLDLPVAPDRAVTGIVAAGGDATNLVGKRGDVASPPVDHPDGPTTSGREPAGTDRPSTVPAGAAPVMGLDLSLASTGVAGPGWSCTLKPRAPIGGLARIRWIARMAADLAETEKVMLVVVEGPAYHQGSDRGAHERAGLWWHVAHILDLRGYPMAVVGPSQLKRYATGKGNAGKDMVLSACVRRFPDFDGGNDAADATWLAAMGADWLGRPMTVVPAAQREALDKVLWPEGVKA